MAPRRTFGHTWWGKAWIDALEQRARLDPNRLPRGRTYARQDRVGDLTVSPGFVEAPVQGSRRQPYTVMIRVRPFTVAEWDRVLDAIAGRAAHAAALLAGDACRPRGVRPGSARRGHAAGPQPGAGGAHARASGAPARRAPRRVGRDPRGPDRAGRRRRRAGLAAAAGRGQRRPGPAGGR